MKSSDARTDLDDQAAGGSSPPAFSLAVLHSPDPALEGRHIRLEDILTIGRAVDQGDLAIEDPKLSRKHAVIRRRPDGGYEVEDLGSANGTFVDRLRVKRHELVAGSILRVGHTLFEAGQEESAPAEVGDDPHLIGRSPPLRRLLDAIERVAPTEVSVLVTGETGTGKELVARSLHARSGRKGPLVAVNCGAIPAPLVESSLFGHKKGAFTDATADSAGYFGAADGGTILLDEIATLPLAIQPKLLRVLETREVTPVGTAAPIRRDVRIVSASNADLMDEIRHGRFRQDLYARIAEYVIETPPLRRRRSDIPLLAGHFLSLVAPGRAFTWTAEFLEALLVGNYPMNVRELRAAIQHAVLHAGDDGTLAVTDLGELPAPPPAPAGDADLPSRAELEATLAQHRGNLTLVARHYGKARMQVYRWLEKYALDPSDYRS